MNKFASFALAASLLTSGTAFAEDAKPEAKADAPKKDGPDGTNSINLNPLSLLGGYYGVSYEHLFDRTHGLLIEPFLYRKASGDTKSSSFGGYAGYRWHWSKSQNSGFLGVNAGAAFGTGSASITTSVNGVSTTKSFDVNTRVIEVTGNVGRRFAWDNGFNLTLRIGAGYANRKVSTDSKDADAQRVVKLVDDLIKFLPIALDGEVSIGFIF